MIKYQKLSMKMICLCLVACALVLARLPAEACSCGSTGTLQESLQSARFVFSGRVLAVRLSPDYPAPSAQFPQSGYYLVTLQVEKNWKGATTSQITLLQPVSSLCGYPFFDFSSGTLSTSPSVIIDSTRRFIVFVRHPINPQQALTASLCSKTGQWSDSTARALDLLAAVTTSVAAPNQAASGSSLFTIASPMPASDQTMLTFSLARPTHVSLELYNALGRRVLDVPSKLLPAGDHREPLDVSALPAGVYFCRIRTSDDVATQKVVVAR
jgi:hypothetical protein